MHEKSLANPSHSDGGALTPRIAVASMFAAFGVAVGLWSGASATKLIQADISPAAFGVILTVNVATYLAAMSFGGFLARFFTAKRILLTSAPLMGLMMATMLATRHAWVIYASLTASGFVGGLVDLTMNAEGTKVEKQLMRPILAGLHGVVSATLAIGAIAGSLLVNSAWPFLAPLIALGVMAAASITVAIGAPEGGLEHESASAPEQARHFSPAIIVLGLVLGVSIACETSTMVWSSILLQSQAPALAAISGLGAAFFAACQAGVRLNADRLRRRFSDRFLMMASMGIAIIGFLIVAADLSFPITVAGFAVIGVGLGAVVPCGFAMAVAQPNVTPSAALSATALFGAVIRLPAPLAVGAIASAVSLSGAFAGFTVILAGAIAALAFLVRPPIANVHPLGERRS